ncbi:MAG: hypothetical protein Q8888_02055 [Vigna little leaf phytoplasma]|nr:hypothetical protein [Vigna little leaf phytoplasma]
MFGVCNFYRWAKSFFSWFFLVITLISTVSSLLYYKRKKQLTPKVFGIIVGVAFFLLLIILGIISYFSTPDEAVYNEKIIQEIDQIDKKYQKGIHKGENLVQKYEELLLPLKKKLQDIEKNKNLTTKQRHKIDKKLALIEKDLTELNQKKIALLQEKNIKAEKKKSLELRKKEQEDRLQELRQKFSTETNNSFKTKLQKEITTLERELVNLNKQINSVEGEITQLNLEIATVANQIDRQEKEKKEYMSQIKALDLQINQLEGERRSTAELLNEIEDELKELRQNIADARQRKEELRTLRNSLMDFVANYDKYKAKHTLERTTLKFMDKIINFCDVFQKSKTIAKSASKLYKIGKETTKLTNSGITIYNRLMFCFDNDGKPRLLSLDSYRTLSQHLKQDIQDFECEIVVAEQKYAKLKNRVWEQTDNKNAIIELHNRKTQISANKDVGAKMTAFEEKEFQNYSTIVAKKTMFDNKKIDKQQLIKDKNAIETKINELTKLKNKIGVMESDEILESIHHLEEQEAAQREAHVQQRAQELIAA